MVIMTIATSTMGLLKDVNDVVVSYASPEDVIVASSM